MSGVRSKSKPATKPTATKSSKSAVSIKEVTGLESTPREKSAVKDKEVTTKNPTKKTAAKPAVKSTDTEKGAG